MKKAALIAFAFLAFACNKKTETENTTTINAEPAATETSATEAEVAYTCSMHPTISGKKGSKCPKCDMDLVPKTE